MKLNLSLAALLILAFGASLLAGRVWLPPSSLLSPHDSLAGLIIQDIRLPRTVLALIVGAVLGLSGAVLQGFTRNPLAEPALLGVSSGAALGAIIAIYFGLAALSPVTGPVMGMALALNFAPNPYAAYEIMSWLLGSLADKSWTQVWLVLPFAAVGAALLAMTGRSLDALSLGEAQAQSLGVNIARLAALVVAGTALGVGAITSVTGAIGFIGLVAPHLVRPFVGYAPRRVLLPASLAGALLLLCADIAARLVHTNPELRLGVFTSLLGTPFFFWLVVRIRKVAP